MALFSRSQEPTIDFGPEKIPASLGVHHFLVCGSTGSGKTVTINRILRKIVTVIAGGADWRALVYDGKTEFLSPLKAFGLPDRARVIMHPFDQRTSAWDLSRDVRTAGEELELAQLLAPPAKNSVNPFFEHSAVDLIQGAIISFNSSHPGRWTLRDLLLALGRSDWLLRILQGRNDLNERRVLQYFPGVRAAYDPTGRSILTGMNKTTQDIMATIGSKVGQYEPIAAHWHRASLAKRTLSLEAWAASSQVLVLGHSHRSTRALNTINRILFKRASQVLLDRPNVEPGSAARRTWLVLDEIGNAGALEGVEDILTKGRSKGICLVIGVQDITGLEREDDYGRNLTELFTSQIANKAILRIEGARTATWAQGVFGEKRELIELWTHKEGDDRKDYLFRQELIQQPHVLASSFMYLPVNPEKGLPGWYKTVMQPTQIQEFTLPRSAVLENPKNDPSEDFVPAPPEWGRLAPWDQDELQKFGLRR